MELLESSCSSLSLVEILTNGKRHTSFCVLLQILLVIKKIKAKFVIGESKYVCGYCKII